MLRRVVQRLQAREVHGRLHLGRVSAEPGVLDGHADAGVGLLAAQRRGEAVRGEDRRVDALGQVAEGLQGLGDDRVEAGGDLPGPLRVLRHQRPGHPQLHHERHQVLLGAVVDVPLDLPPLGVLRGHDPLTRGPDLRRLRRDLLQPPGELGGEADVAQHVPGLRGDVAEEPQVDRRDGAPRGLADGDGAHELAAVLHGEGQLGVGERRELVAGEHDRGRGRGPLGPRRHRDELGAESQPHAGRLDPGALGDDAGRLGEELGGLRGAGHPVGELGQDLVRRRPVAVHQALGDALRPGPGQGRSRWPPPRWRRRTARCSTTNRSARRRRSGARGRRCR